MCLLMVLLLSFFICLILNFFMQNEVIVELQIMVCFIFLKERLLVWVIQFIKLFVKVFLVLVGLKIFVSGSVGVKKIFLFLKSRVLCFFFLIMRCLGFMLWIIFVVFIRECFFDSCWVFLLLMIRLLIFLRICNRFFIVVFIQKFMVFSVINFGWLFNWLIIFDCIDGVRLFNIRYFVFLQLFGRIGLKFVSMLSWVLRVLWLFRLLWYLLV